MNQLIKRIAITGAGGYIGGRLVQELAASGHDVVAITRRPIHWLPQAVVITAEDDSTALVAAFEGADAVINLAGANEVVASADPDAALAATASMARRTAVAAASAGVERVVYLSTVHVYGRQLSPVGAAGATPVVIETSTSPAPNHPYAIARLAGEFLTQSCGVIHPVVLRLTNTVGAPCDARVDRWSLVANDLCAMAARGEDLVLQSSGWQWRDFLGLGGACAAIGRAATEALPAGTYNLGAGKSQTVLSLAHEVANATERVLGSRPSVIAPDHVGAIPTEVIVDSSSLTQRIGPIDISLDQELENTIRLCLVSKD